MAWRVALHQSFFAVGLRVFGEMEIGGFDVAGLKERITPAVKERRVARTMPRLATANETEFVQLGGFPFSLVGWVRPSGRNPPFGMAGYGASRLTNPTNP